MARRGQYSKRVRGLSIPCRLCRRRVLPEQVRVDGLCSTCATDRASKWLKSAEKRPRRS